MRSRWIAAGLGVAFALAAVGCSTPAMKATPIWDGEYAKAEGPPEDRINLWPLFYYRRPAYSVLWPLFSATDEGHALVPFYEYGRAEDELRLVTVHPWLPAGAVIEPDYVRVLNVVRDGGDDRFTVFPVFSRSPEDLLVLPFLYKNERGFWTPLLTHFARPDESTVGLLGPLFVRHREHGLETWHFPWPALSTWSGADRFGVKVLPLLWYDRDGDRLSTHWVWPLGAAGRRGDEAWSRFVPFWYWRRSGPQSVFASVPYLELRDRDGRWQSLFGLLHRFQGTSGQGHAFLPLYWRQSGANVDGLLTLLGGYWRSGDRELFDVLGPVYWSLRRGDMRTRAVLWPLYRQQTRTGFRKTSLLLGLAGHERDVSRDAGRRRLWAYPLFAWSSGAAWYRFSSLLWSRSHSRHDRESSERRARESLEKSPVGPGAFVDRSLSHDSWGSLLGWIELRNSVALRGRRGEAGAVEFSTRYRRTRQVRPLWVLPVFWSEEREHESSGLELFWRLYAGESRVLDDGRTYTRQRVLWRIFHRESLGERTSVDVFPFIAYDRDQNLWQWSFMGGLVGWRTKGGERTLRLFYLPLSL